MAIRVAAWIISQLVLISVCAAQVKTSTALLETGKRQFNEGQFTAAADSFRRAADLDPNSAAALQLLTRALLAQVPYNLQLLPDVGGVLPKAEAAAEQAVRLAPSDASAWCALGLVRNKLANAARDPKTKAGELNDADRAFKKALSIDPESFEAHYELGDMASEMAIYPLLAARQRSGVPIGKPGRIQNTELLQTMQERYSAQINAAIEHTRHALRIDPKSWKAMNQMAGLLNERSVIEDTDESAKADHDAATAWEKKSAAARPAAPAAPVNPQRLATASSIAQFMSAGTPLAPGQQSGTMLVILPEEAAKNLVKKIDPAYPDSAKRAGISGDVQFRIWVNKQGRVQRVELLSGDPQLVGSARDAVQKWEYKPAILDGQAQEFMTSVVVRFVR